jgi:hypothetical protein
MIMLKVSVFSRVEKLEKILRALQPQDDWQDFYMWNCVGGIFGHSHYRFSRSRGEITWIPCTDEEELEIMRRQYENDDKRLYGKGAEISFAEYLEWFSYLGPEALAERRKSIIEKVRSDACGEGVGDSGC